MELFPPETTRFIGASPYSLGRAKPCPVGRLGGFFGGAAGVDEIAGDASVDERDALAGNAFAVEGSAELFGVVDIVGDGDVFPEERFAESAGKAGTLIADGGGGEIVEEETDEVENGSGFEDDGVAAGREFDGIFRARGFFAGDFGKFEGIEGAEISGIGLGPTGG